MLMVMFVSLMDWYKQRELYRCVWEGDGENCVGTTGTNQMNITIVRTTICFKVKIKKCGNRVVYTL